MKKKKLLGLLLLFVLPFSLCSCDLKGNSNDDGGQGISEGNTDKLLKEAYDEYVKSYSGVSYEEFKLKALMTKRGSTIEFNVQDQLTIYFENGKLTAKDEFIYSDDKNELTVIKSKLKDGEWVKEAREIYIYNSAIHRMLLLNKGKYVGEKVCLELIYDYNDNGSYKTRAQAGYDERGNCLLRLVSVFGEYDWVSFSSEAFTYDSEGNETSSTYYKYIDGQWVAQ